MGCVYKPVVLKYMHSFHLSVVIYLSIIGKLARVLRGLGVVVGVAGWCHDGLLLWPLGPN
jgi:hypothetical protein